MNILILYEKESFRDSAKKYFSSYYKQNIDRFKDDQHNVRVLKVNADTPLDTKKDILKGKCDEKDTGDVDLLIGPTTSSLVAYLIKDEKIKKIPLITTNATSSALNELSDKENYFQLGTNNRKRVIHLLEKIIEFYPKFKDIYIFTKKENSKNEFEKYSYSKNLRDEIIKQVITNDKLKKKFHTNLFHDIEFEAHYKDLELESDDENKMTKKIVSRINIEHSLPISSKYPILVCAESIETVALVKYLRDSGYRNTIFGFGNNPKMKRSIMEDSYLVTDLDSEKKEGEKRIKEITAEHVLKDLVHELCDNHFPKFEKDKLLTHKTFNNGYESDNLALKKIKEKEGIYSFFDIQEKDYKKISKSIDKVRIEENQKYLSVQFGKKSLYTAIVALIIPLVISVISFTNSNRKTDELIKYLDSVNTNLEILVKKSDTTKILDKNKTLLPKNESKEENKKQHQVPEDIQS